MSDTIKTECPGCKTRLSVSAVHAGKSLRCPKCDKMLTVPTVESDPVVVLRNDDVSQSVYRPRRSRDLVSSIRDFFTDCAPEFNSFKADLWKSANTALEHALQRRMFQKFALAVGLIGWFSANESRDERNIFCYPSIVLSFLAAHYVFRPKKGWPRWALPVTILTTGLVLYAWGSSDTIKDRWIKGSTRYSDTRQRWSGRLRARHFAVYDSPEALQSSDGVLFSEVRAMYWGHGPMAGTGKPHGQWECGTPGPSRFESNVRTVFYWYGEAISEGEWHLRNR